MAKKIPTEATLMIKSLPMDQLVTLHKINKDKKLKQEVVNILREILEQSRTKIARSAGGVNSLDSLIANGVNQSFYRGRISAVTLLNALITKSSDEVERREEEGKRK